MSDYRYTRSMTEPGIYEVIHKATSTYLGKVCRGHNPAEWIAASPDGVVIAESGSRESAANRLRRNARANGRLP